MTQTQQKSKMLNNAVSAIEAAAASLAPDQTDAENPVSRLWRRLEKSFDAETAETDRTRSDDCKVALARFLAITGGRQSNRRIHEAMPHLDPVDTIQAFRTVLFRLGFHSSIKPYDAEIVREEYLPCFLLGEEGRIFLIERASKENGSISIYDTDEAELIECDAKTLAGTLILPSPTEITTAQSAGAVRRWSLSIIGAFKSVLTGIFLIGFITNFFALITPLFVMNVYDKAIGAGSLDILFGLTIGIVVVVAAEFGLRLVRGRMQSYLGARLDNQINAQAFRHLLYMPLPYTESAPLGSQLTRLNQITSIRDAFTGSLAAAFFDLPFLIIFIAAIAMIGGSLVFIPVGLICAYVVLAAWAIPATKRAVRIAGDKKAQLHNLIVEAVSSQQAIFDLNAEDIWLRKHRKYSAEAVKANMETRQINNFTQTLSQSLVTLAGVLTLAMGVQYVVDGNLTSGALIAVMALCWRVLNPVRTIFLSSLTLGQTLQSIDQIDRLLRIPLEREPTATASVPRSFEGPVVFDRISFRYPSQKEPALQGVSFAIKPGELMCVCGASGSGKSTLLRMLIGLYTQQSGSILIGGVDLRQVDVGEWRQSIGVAPESADFFFGTVAQNLRLADPSASDAQIEEIGKKFMLDEFFGGALDRGYDTKITGHALRAWPDALKKRLLLSRTFLSHQSLYLLDSPGANLDADGEKALLDVIAERRPNSKIIMATHRPSHMRIADKVLWLEKGAVRKFGKPENVLPEMLAQ